MNFDYDLSDWIKKEKITIDKEKEREKYKISSHFFLSSMFFSLDEKILALR